MPAARCTSVAARKVASPVTASEPESQLVRGDQERFQPGDLGWLDIGPQSDMKEAGWQKWA